MFRLLLHYFAQKTSFKSHRHFRALKSIRAFHLTTGSGWTDAGLMYILESVDWHILGVKRHNVHFRIAGLTYILELRD